MAIHLSSQIKLGRDGRELTDEELSEAVRASLPKAGLKGKRVLLIPPDSTRLHSGAGVITNLYYHLLKDSCEVDILPALGTHVAMTQKEISKMYGDIPFSKFLAHDWRKDVVKIGEVPRGYIEEISEGLLHESIDIEINRHLLEPSYDLILSIGQVLPHEVVGMANYTKNILIGCGGSKLINASHYLGAIYGLERLMGKDIGPVRALLDYAQENLLKDIPLDYVLIVATAQRNRVNLHGLYIGGGRDYFEQAVELSQQKNIVFTDKPFQKVIVYLNEEEFKSTWLGNKAIYRTRMAIEDGGELIIIAPGVKRFGEDPEIDKLIRKYGYKGRLKIIECCRQFDDLKQNLSAAAHLIHGSSDGRFNIAYCPGHLSEEEVRSVGFSHIPLAEAVAKYKPNTLKDGYNTVNGEEIFFVRNPAIGLWADRARFEMGPS